MSIPNIGPEHPDPDDPDAAEASRRGNPSAIYRGSEAPTDDVSAASTRASGVTHRFGGVRYALSRPEAGGPPGPSSEGEKESDGGA